MHNMNMRVLVVDDEPKIVDLLKRGLQQQGFVVDTCDNGEDALRLAQTETYGVIVLDRRLPGRYDGVAVCKKLRSEGNHTPVLMLTAKGLPPDRIIGLNSGADDYLVKPFDFGELIARINALGRRPQKMDAVALRYGDLTLDTVSHAVTRGELAPEMTAREIAVLEYFMRNPGRVLSKDAIIANVWPYDSVAISNNVEVYVRLLRRKLDRPGEPSIIKTIKGLGYKLSI